ncbi:hypothetical protein PG984_013398 [Apiospora sp. TS-2023a]
MNYQTRDAVIAKLRESGLSDVLYLPGEDKYDARVASYWSLSPRLHPWAFVQPRNTDEVSKAVKAIVTTDSVKFALRGGGHTCYAGSNNIETGVTIDLSLLTETTYNAVTGIAHVLPGARWTDVYDYVQSHGVMVAGGREGLVGVGGFITGGGKTFYTCRYGFACDDVVNYEVVLADGSIVMANEQTNMDLFRVLKGGSSNFGIVTCFDLKAFPATPVWDGSAVYQKTEKEALLKAFSNFTKRLNHYPDSHVLLGWMYVPQVSKEIFSSTTLTHLDGVENAESLQEFLDIPCQSSMKVTGIAEKVAAFLLPSDKYDTWFTLTYKLDDRSLHKTLEIFETLVEKFKAIFDDRFSLLLYLQPLPASFIKNSATRGGNMLGLESVTEDSVLLVMDIMVPDKEQETASFPIVQAAIKDMEDYTKSIDGAVAFRYLNYCNGSQDPLGSYGAENIKKMKDAAAKYDPTGVFQTRMPGGFKISKVQS